MKRPSIKSPCVADRYHGAGERIAEITLPDGRGFLLSISNDGEVSIYQAGGHFHVQAYGARGPQGLTADSITIDLPSLGDDARTEEE